MAIINCTECGKEFSDQAKMCPNCGYPLKKKGKGFAVASLVLGIISIVYSMPVFSMLFQTAVQKNEIISIAVYMMIFGILSLVFGIVSHLKGCKLIKKIVGIVLSAISLVLLLTVIIIASISL